MDRDDIAGIVAAHTDGPPDPSVVDSVLARSEGNPLYAEELLAANQEGVPDHLSDLLLARIDALDEGPRALLRVASVNGTRLDTATLAELAGLDQTQMEGCLREALDANVLRQNGGHLEFRHPLLREAAYDDLMPDERTRTHGRLAEILQARVDADPNPGLTTLSRLAFHWDAAHDLPRTLAASVQAGLTAARLGAAEQVTHLERALSLWDRVPDPEVVAGLRQIELVVRLGELRTTPTTLNAGTGWRVAPSTCSRQTPTRCWRAWPTPPWPAASCSMRIRSARRSRCVALSRTPGTPRARSWRVPCSSRPPSTTPLTALRHSHSPLRSERIDVAEAIGRTDLMLSADEWRANNLYHLGRVAEALAEREHGVAAYRRAGLIARAVAATEHLAWLCAAAGQVDRCLTLASAGVDEATALGLKQQAAACGDPAVEALIWLGRLDEAAEARGLSVAWDSSTDVTAACSPELLLARGEARAARPVLQEEASHLAGSSRHPEDIEVLGELQLAAMLNDQRPPWAWRRRTSPNWRTATRRS